MVNWTAVNIRVASELTAQVSINNLRDKEVRFFRQCSVILFVTLQLLNRTKKKGTKIRVFEITNQKETKGLHQLK